MAHLWALWLSRQQWHLLGEVFPHLETSNKKPTGKPRGSEPLETNSKTIATNNGNFRLFWNVMLVISDSFDFWDWSLKACAEHHHFFLKCLSGVSIPMILHWIFSVAWVTRWGAGMQQRSLPKCARSKRKDSCKSARSLKSCQFALGCSANLIVVRLRSICFAVRSLRNVMPFCIWRIQKEAWNMATLWWLEG